MRRERVLRYLIPGLILCERAASSGGSERPRKQYISRDRRFLYPVHVQSQCSHATLPKCYTSTRRQYQPNTQPCPVPVAEACQHTTVVVPYHWKDVLISSAIMPCWLGWTMSEPMGFLLYRSHTEWSVSCNATVSVLSCA